MDIVQMLGLDITKVVSFVLFGTRYRMPLWEIGVLLGVTSWALAFLINIKAPMSASRIKSFSLYVIFAPIIEEFVFRFALIIFFASLFNEILTAVLAAAFLFAIGHAFIYGRLRMIDTFLMGILYGLVFLQFGIAPTIIAHMTHNFLAELRRG